ncbi:MAG: hypothetical protein QG671_3128 [Actinomycetota bacterium]|nr:hypothetical protein [Actinomycetota bacterium]
MTSSPGNQSPPSTRPIHLTPAERVAVGKAARAQSPRSGHAVFDPLPTRPDPVSLLESQSASRVAELVPLRYGRMLASPFTFFRGAALVMAADLATTPRSGLQVQACGDAHLSNFGAFGTPERSLVFDINDFDETTPGPWEWDVKRLATSLEVAGRSRGFSTKERRTIVRACVRVYRETMAKFAKMRTLDVWYARYDIGDQLQTLSRRVDAKTARRAQRNLAKARTRDSLQALEKFTEVVDGRRRIVSAPPVIVRVEELIARSAYEGGDTAEVIRQMIAGFRSTLQSDRRHLLEQYEFVDMARKVVGVGSVGTRAWMALFLGRDGGDPLFLQIKQAQTSVLEAYVGRSEFTNSGERVVAGQRLMQSASDIFLGWQRIPGLDGVERDFYIRQLRDWKGSADVDSMSPLALKTYGQMCAWTLAKAHARSGDRVAIATYLGRSDVFDQAIAQFSASYADQNEQDFQQLRNAVDSGRITARFDG